MGIIWIQNDPWIKEISCRWTRLLTNCSERGEKEPISKQRHDERWTTTCRIFFSLWYYSDQRNKLLVLMTSYNSILISSMHFFTSKLEELSFRPEPELWIQKRLLIERPVPHVTSVSWCSPMFRRACRIGDRRGRGDSSDDDIDWKNLLNSSPRNCASSWITRSRVSSLIFGRHPCMIMQSFAPSYTSRTKPKIWLIGWCRSLRIWRDRELKMSVNKTCGQTCKRVHLALVNVSPLPGTFKQYLNIRIRDRKSRSVVFLV